MKRIFLCLFFLFSVLYSQFSIAQKEHNVWYFGYHDGLDFNSGTPVALTGGQTNTNEGSASICDVSGKLLFYTEGINVWDSTHTLMPNGTGLLGGTSSTQSALILPKPGSATLYYVFTAPQFIGNSGAAYSIVDMTLNGGKGDVTIKNSPLVKPAAEKITYCKHSNGTDYWVIFHMASGNNSFYVYLLTASGLNTTPVISSTGLSALYSNSSSIGYLKANSCGTKLASVLYDSGSFELFDFNNSTGVVSNAYTVDVFGSTGGGYGVEFSPQGNFLYASLFYTGEVFQYDMNAGSNAAITTSKTLAGVQKNYAGAIQNGPDGKMYISGAGRWLDAINFPDLKAPACAYKDSAVDVITTTISLGLPNFIMTQSCGTAQKPTAVFTSSDTVFCNESGNCIDFFDHSINNPTSWKWYFPGATPDTSTMQNPTGICYYLPGTYPVSLVVSNSAGSDSLTVSSLIVFNTSASAPGLNFSNDTIYCSHAAAYQWYFNGSPISGATDSFLVIIGDGTYAVKITDANGCDRLSAGFPVIIRDHYVEGGIMIYPNPVGEKLFVNCYSLIGGTVKLFDLPGQMILQSEIKNAKSEIDLSRLAKGIYIIEVSNDEKVFRNRIVKQ